MCHIFQIHRASASYHFNAWLPLISVHIQLITDTRVRQLRSTDTRHELDAQQFWRRDLCRCRTTSLEKYAVQSLTMWWLWAVIRPLQAVTEDIFIRTVRPRHSVNCFYLHRIEIFLLTYLLSMHTVGNHVLTTLCQCAVYLISHLLHFHCIKYLDLLTPPRLPVNYNNSDYVDFM